MAPGAGHAYDSILLATKANGMAQVLVRDLPEETVARLKSKAAEAGRSLEAELRDILNRAAQPTKEQEEREALQALREIRARSRPWRPGEPTAADLIREDRDSR
jgi:plasmid stability protein